MSILIIADFPDYIHVALYNFAIVASLHFFKLGCVTMLGRIKKESEEKRSKKKRTQIIFQKDMIVNYIHKNWAKNTKSTYLSFGNMPCMFENKVLHTKIYLSHIMPHTLLLHTGLTKKLFPIKGVAGEMSHWMSLRGHILTQIFPTLVQERAKRWNSVSNKILERWHEKCFSKLKKDGRTPAEQFCTS